MVDTRIGPRSVGTKAQPKKVSRSSAREARTLLQLSTGRSYGEMSLGYLIRGSIEMEERSWEGRCTIRLSPEETDGILR